MNRTILKPFEDYQKARTQFVQTIAELAQRNENIDALQSAGVLYLLRPLLLDNVPSIQQSAALALGRIASHSEELADAIVANEILPQLVFSLSEKNRFYKKAAAFVLRSIAKHNQKLARQVVDSGALDSLVTCLEEFDPAVKEASCQALAAIAKHEVDLANAVFSAGAVPLIILCLQEPELTLKRASINALSEVAKHNEELAQVIVDGKAVHYLKGLMGFNDANVKKNVCFALAQIAKHNQDLASAVVDADILPDVFNRLKDTDNQVRKNAATLIREICKRNDTMAMAVVNGGGVSPLVDFINDSKGQQAINALPAVMTLGFIAAWHETLANAVIQTKGVEALLRVLIEDQEHHLKGAAAWSLGQCGRHTEQHAYALCEKETLSKLLAVYLMDDAKDNDDLRNKTKQALKSIIANSKHVGELVAVFNLAPYNVVRYIIPQLLNVFHDKDMSKKAKVHFIQNNGYQRMMNWKKTLHSNPEYKEATETNNQIESIIKMFPDKLQYIYDPDAYNNILDDIRD